MNPIPFEKEYPREAEFLMSLYAENKSLKWYCSKFGIFEWIPKLKKWFRL